MKEVLSAVLPGLVGPTHQKNKEHGQAWGGGIVRFVFLYGGPNKIKS